MYDYSEFADLGVLQVFGKVPVSSGLRKALVDHLKAFWQTSSEWKRLLSALWLGEWPKQPQIGQNHWTRPFTFWLSKPWD